MAQKECEQYQQTISEESTSAQRLLASKRFVESLTNARRRQRGRPTKVPIGSCVALLLRVCLDSQQTTAELQAFLQSEVVVALVQSHWHGEAEYGDVLNGMNKAVSHPGVGMNGFRTYACDLLKTWFTQKGKVLPTGETFLVRMLQFVFVCGSRQEEVCGHIHDDMPNQRRTLLPLVTEMCQREVYSLNHVDSWGYTALHYAASLLCLWDVTLEILSHDFIDVAVKDEKGRVPLSLLVDPHKSGPSLCRPLTELEGDIFSSLLDRTRDDEICVEDATGKTVVDHLCLHLNQEDSDQNLALELISTVFNHYMTVSAEVCRRTFAALMQWMKTARAADADIVQYIDAMKAVVGCQNFSIAESHTAAVIDMFTTSLVTPECQGDLLEVILHGVKVFCNTAELTPQQMQLLFLKVFDEKSMCDRRILNLKYEIYQSLLQHQTFPINDWIWNEKTVSQLAAREGNVKLLEMIIKHSGFDPNAKCALDNTLLFYMCECFPVEVITRYLRNPEIQWNFSAKNSVGQTVFDYYSHLNSRNPIVYKLLEEKCRGTGNCAQRGIVPVELMSRPIRWMTLTGDMNSDVCVKRSNQSFVSATYEKDEVYSMNKKIAGKACIIYIPKFETSTNILYELKGYHRDAEKLMKVWAQMGLRVYMPMIQSGQHYLTAEEISLAVSEFKKELTEDDQCCVLCLLSHGNDGFIYGSDGKTVDLDQLYRNFDNVQCINMVDKPKVMIVQSCQGGKADLGLHVRAGPVDPIDPPINALNLPTHPSVSDIVVFKPSMPGYVSFVRNRSHENPGSVFIRHLVKVLSDFAHKEHILDLFTRVNREVSDELIKAIKCGTTSEDYFKQQPCFTTCLRKKLYFYPCPDQGGDWEVGD